jgi:hypothetical protein
MGMILFDLRDLIGDNYFFGSIAEMILYLYLLGLYSKIIESAKCACLYMNWTIYLNQSNIYFIYSLSL